MRELKDLTENQFKILKAAHMLWEFYPTAPEFYKDISKGGNMNKDQKEILAIVMQYVNDLENHKIDEEEIKDKIDDIIEQIEELANGIEIGLYEEVEPDADDRGCEKYHQKKDDDMEMEE